MSQSLQLIFGIKIRENFLPRPTEYRNQPIASFPKKSTMTSPVRPSQQKLNSLNVTLLKNLKDVELDFSAAPLTALMGTNGSGKTTVLHALACVYGPPDKKAPNYKFPMYFKPNSDSVWSGSKFELRYSERLGAVQNLDLAKEYSKAADRWTPKYERRPIRFTRLLTIRESVPEVEAININAMVHYSRLARLTQEDDLIRTVAGEVMNRNYTAYHNVAYQRAVRDSIGVSTESLTYPALSMSAGEQRVFRILEAVFSAPDYALILIDEIDLFLHQDALQRLLGKLHSHCQQKNKQLVMTTHFPPVAKMYVDVAITTLHRTSERTIFWTGYSVAALRHITGEQEKPLSIFVEDDVAETIVGQVSSNLRLRPYVNIVQFGAASNAFKVGAGILLAGRQLENVLIVMDGDVQATKPERREKVKSELTGTEVVRTDQRKAVLAAIRCFKPIGNKSPEQMLHKLLRTVDGANLDQEDADLLRIVHEVNNVPDRHGLVNHIIELTGEARPVALAKLVKLASRAQGWKRYTALVRHALGQRRTLLNLDMAQPHCG